MKRFLTTDLTLFLTLANSFWGIDGFEGGGVEMHILKSTLKHFCRCIIAKVDFLSSTVAYPNGVLEQSFEVGPESK